MLIRGVGVPIPGFPFSPGGVGVRAGGGAWAPLAGAGRAWALGRWARVVRGGGAVPGGRRKGEGDTTHQGASVEIPTGGKAGGQSRTNKKGETEDRLPWLTDEE
jgi:hypothetical protein